MSVCVCVCMCVCVCVCVNNFRATAYKEKVEMLQNDVKLLNAKMVKQEEFFVHTQSMFSQIQQHMHHTAQLVPMMHRLMGMEQPHGYNMNGNTAIAPPPMSIQPRPQQMVQTGHGQMYTYPNNYPIRQLPDQSRFLSNSKKSALTGYGQLFSFSQLRLVAQNKQSNRPWPGLKTSKHPKSGFTRKDSGQAENCKKFANVVPN